MGIRNILLYGLCHIPEWWGYIPAHPSLWMLLSSYAAGLLILWLSNLYFEKVTGNQLFPGKSHCPHFPLVLPLLECSVLRTVLAPLLREQRRGSRCLRKTRRLSLADENQVGNVLTVRIVPMPTVSEYRQRSSKNTHLKNTDFCLLGELWHTRHG